jgi:hypothetical protein
MGNSRVIKFRAWDKGKANMLFGSLNSFLFTFSSVMI